ncbi:MAG: biotin--[acetyl-CoA-carboxylase] ligase [Thermoplasmata archaeon]
MALREYFDVIPSTQDRAIALARSHAEPGSRVVAARQQDGRGRLDHRWQSPTGGLYLSILLPDVPGAPTLLPVGLGASLADRLHARFGRPFWVKWPNDLVVPGADGLPRKAGGILVDRVPTSVGGYAVVAGFGINVRSDVSSLPPDLRERAVSLSDLLPRPPSVEQTEEIVSTVAESTGAQLNDPTSRAAVLALARHRLFGRGRPVWVDGEPSGMIQGLDDDGALELDRNGERILVRAGDLRFHAP